jgi:hypothetical protein
MAKDLRDQLGWCITTKDYLNGLNGNLSDVSRQYQNMVNELRNHECMDNMVSVADVMSVEFDKEIRGLIKYIEDEHLAYIQKQSVAIVAAINNLQSMKNK